MNWRCLTDLQSGCWYRLEQSPRGGPAGEEMLCTAAGIWRAVVAAQGRKRSAKASVAVQEMGVRGMLYIPQRRYICTDRCSRANLRRRGGLPAAELQVRQKKWKPPTPSLILTFLPFLLFVDFFIDFFPYFSLGPMLKGQSLSVSQPVTLGRFLRLCTPWALITAGIENVSNQRMNRLI